MKHTWIALLVALVALAGCLSQKGDPGPAGATGAQGSQGPQGVPGTANVIYSSWFYSSPWNLYGSLWISANNASLITQTVLDQGVVIAYYRPSATGPVYPLPTPGEPQLNFYTGLGMLYLTGDGSVPLSAFQYRYILIPGGLPSGRTTTVDYSDYESVVEFYGIPK